MRHFVVVCSVCLAFLLPGTAFADNVPTAFELCKRMYDNRIAIDAIKLKATSQKRVFTSDPSREKEVVVYELQYSHGRFRCDKTNSYLNSPKKKLEQYLHTSDCHFFRYPLNHTGRNNGDSSTLATIDTNNIKPCYDPRQMGLLMTSVDALPTIIFDFESVTKLLYPSIVSDFHVVRDEIGGENVWKVTYRADKTDYNCSYWIDDKKGCNLVRFTSTAPSCHLEYVVTLQEFATSSGQVWFPNKTILKCKYGADMLEEEVAISPISFDTTDESFTLKELGLPTGHEVLLNGDELKYWNGNSLVDNIPYPLPASGIGKRFYLWMINAVFLVIIAFLWLKKSFRRWNDKSTSF